jgi:hypothetical protein
MTKELEAYESIIQNLLALKNKAKETKPEEAKAIGAILDTLLALRQSMCISNVCPVSLPREPVGALS